MFSREQNINLGIECKLNIDYCLLNIDYFSTLPT